MEYYAGKTALGDRAGDRDSGLIMVVDAPGSDVQIGVATHVAEQREGRGLYSLSLSPGYPSTPGRWILDNGRFLQVQ